MNSGRWLCHRLFCRNWLYLNRRGLLGSVAGGAAGAFTGTLVATGSFSQAQRAGAFGALSGGLAFGIGHGFGGGGVRYKALAHGIAQGSVNVLRGGKFGSGFAGGFFGKVTGGFTRGFKSVYARTAATAAIGGTIAKAVGGKFANGAVSAAFVHLFNSEAKSLYETLTQKQHAKILSDIRNQVEIELNEIKSLYKDAEFGSIESLSLLESHQSLADC